MKKYILSFFYLKANISYQLLIKNKKNYEKIITDDFEEIKKIINQTNKINLDILFFCDFHWSKEATIPLRHKYQRKKEWEFQLNNEFPNALKDHDCLKSEKNNQIVAFFYHKEIFTYFKNVIVANIKELRAKINKIKSFPWGIERTIAPSKARFFINLESNYGWYLEINQGIITSYVLFPFGYNDEMVAKILLKLLHPNCHILETNNLVLNLACNSNDKSKAILKIIDLLKVFPYFKITYDILLQDEILLSKTTNILEKRLKDALDEK